MSTVLAALDSNATSSPVLSTAVAVAFMFDATVIALHVRKNGTSGAEELARAAGVELPELSGPPVDQIVAAAPEPQHLAAPRPRRARNGTEVLPDRRAHRSRCHHARARARHRRPTQRTTAEAARAHSGAARRDQRELACPRGHDQARPPQRTGDPRPARPLARHRASVRQSRPTRTRASARSLPIPPTRTTTSPCCAASASPPTNRHGRPRDRCRPHRPRLEPEPQPRPRARGVRGARA